MNLLFDEYHRDSLDVLLERSFDFLDQVYQDFANEERNYSNPYRLFREIYSYIMEMEIQFFVVHCYN